MQSEEQRRPFIRGDLEKGKRQEKKLACPYWSEISAEENFQDFHFLTQKKKKKKKKEKRSPNKILGNPFRIQKEEEKRTLIKY